MKIKKIFSLKRAILLKNMGNSILYSEQNRKYPKFQVFVFEETNKLLNDLNKLYK